MNISEEEFKRQLELVKQNGFIIKHIQDPCKEVQLEAVKQNEHAIRWIKNPCEEVKDYLYGESTNIEWNQKVCKVCEKKFCNYKSRSYLRSECFIRSGCPYLIEHKVLS